MSLPAWPNGARVAVLVSVLLEAWADGKSPSYFPRTTPLKAGQVDRAGARWSNGDPVTSADFLFSYERMLSPAFGAEYASMLHGVRGAKDFAAGSAAYDEMYGNVSGTQRAVLNMNKAILSLRIDAEDKARALKLIDAALADDLKLETLTGAEITAEVQGQIKDVLNIFSTFLIVRIRHIGFVQFVAWLPVLLAALQSPVLLAAPMYPVLVAAPPSPVLVAAPMAACAIHASCPGCRYRTTCM
mgnify:CR=1 FL=1